MLMVMVIGYPLSRMHFSINFISPEYESGSYEVVSSVRGFPGAACSDVVEKTVARKIPLLSAAIIVCNVRKAQLGARRPRLLVSLVDIRVVASGRPANQLNRLVSFTPTPAKTTDCALSPFPNIW